MSGGDLIEMRKVRIKKQLYNMLRHRLLTGDDSESACIAFARSLASTYEITSNSMYDAHDINLADYASTIQVALYMH